MSVGGLDSGHDVISIVEGRSSCWFWGVVDGGVNVGSSVTSIISYSLNIFIIYA